jgi:hypothetical protein
LLHVFLIRCGERSLLNGFNNECDTLAAADAGGTETVSLSTSA